MIELRVKLISFSTRIRQEAFLVKLFSNLKRRILHWFFFRSYMSEELTSSSFLGASFNSLDPDFCSSTVVRGSGFLTIRGISICHASHRISRKIPFLSGLLNNLHDSRKRIAQNMLIQSQSDVEIK